MSHRSASRTLKVDTLARVEGEGAMRVLVKDDKVSAVQLRIYEPPRFFEAFLQGRSFSEPPDITARICGICPVAYQMSSCQAIEEALGVIVPQPIADLRRLLYCGEWIESHVLHVYLLHAPDFLGFESAVHLAAEHRELVETALQLKKVGNDLVDIIGGRAIHPINVRVGGWYRVPTKAELRPVQERLRWALEAALDTVRLVSTFDFPDFTYDHEMVALRQEGKYGIDGGRLVSDRGLDIASDQFEEHFFEEHVRHSTALHGRRRGRGLYTVGPNARYTMNYDLLSPIAKQAAVEAGLGPECRNPFQSIIVRSIETVYAIDEALRLIEGYERPDRPYVEVEPGPGVGHGWTEAPRGVLYHRYELDDHGLVRSARIVPPTAQNQPAIEDDLRRFVETRLELPTDRLTWECEQAIRNYDPCISCATHFLELTVDKG